MSALNAADEMGVVTQEFAVKERATQPFLWSARRELWENGSIFVAPAAVATVILFGFVFTGVKHGREFMAVAMSGSNANNQLIAAPFSFAASVLMVTAFVVGVFYSLDALYGERKDRSIFFWKSLPVSDWTTVLAKVSVPLVILPVVTFAFVVVTQVAMVVLGSLALVAGGASAKPLWTQVPLLTMWAVLAYGVVVTSLWYAPIYAYLLLVSAWVKRAAFLFAVLPVVLISVFEKIAFNSDHFSKWLGYRFTGLFTRAFMGSMHHANAVIPLSDLTPGRFLMSPGLWTGLMFAAVVIFAVVRIRRYREPI